MVWNLADGDGTLLVEMSVRALKVAKKTRFRRLESITAQWESVTHEL